MIALRFRFAFNRRRLRRICLIALRLGVLRGAVGGVALHLRRLRLLIRDRLFALGIKAESAGRDRKDKRNHEADAGALRGAPIGGSDRLRVRQLPRLLLLPLLPPRLRLRPRGFLLGAAGREIGAVPRIELRRDVGARIQP